MNIGDPFAQLRPLLKLAGAILIFVALAKLFGVQIGLAGGIEEDALVGLGLLHV